VTGVRRLEDRLAAWVSFRDVAHATRSLAAAQALRWSGQLSRASAHLATVAALEAEVATWGEAPRPRPGGACALLALGTDLGLCGRLNQLVAEATLAASREHEVSTLIVVGSRLDDLLPAELARVVEPTPSSAVAAADLSERLEARLAREGLLGRLLIVGSASVGSGGNPEVASAWEPPLAAEPRRARRRPARFTSPGLGRERAQALLAHARIFHALCAAAHTEASVRLARMTRAHESADRRIGEQERELRKVRQESITQEMLEVLSGSHGGERAGAP